MIPTVGYIDQVFYTLFDFSIFQSLKDLRDLRDLKSQKVNEALDLYNRK